MQENMELPVYKIKDTDFYVDVMSNRLLEKGNLRNTILFSQMDYKGRYYELDFNPRIKNVGSSIHPGEQLRVPQLVKLDAFGLAVKFDKSVAEVEKLSDFELMVDQDLLEKRLSGELPKMLVCGQYFFVDLENGLLRPEGHDRSAGIVFSKQV